MNPLPKPASFHLHAAIGWLELGNVIEANAELENISPTLRAHPDVLGVRWEIYAKQHRWDGCFQIASAMVELAPGKIEGWLYRSYALHEMKETEKARDLLLPAAEKFPNDSTILYNLACYESRLGNLKPAGSGWNELLILAMPNN